MTDPIDHIGNRLLRKKSSRSKKYDRRSLRTFPSVGEDAFMSSVRGDLQNAEVFHSVLNRAAGEDVPELLDAVYSAGERLKERPILENVRQYRQAVKGFLNHVVTRMMIVEENTSGFSIVKRKRFTLIKVIDKQLQNLTDEVIYNQKEQLNILESVDEINGLLVDLVS